MGERETQKACLDPDKMLGASDQPFDSEPLFPRAYSPASAVGAPDEQDLLQAEVQDLRGRTQRAELRVEVLSRALERAREALKAWGTDAHVAEIDRALQPPPERPAPALERCPQCGGHGRSYFTNWKCSLCRGTGNVVPGPASEHSQGEE